MIQIFLSVHCELLLLLNYCFVEEFFFMLDGFFPDEEKAVCFVAVDFLFLIIGILIVLLLSTYKCHRSIFVGMSLQVFHVFVTPELKVLALHRIVNHLL